MLESKPGPKSIIKADLHDYSIDADDSRPARAYAKSPRL